MCRARRRFGDAMVCVRVGCEGGLPARPTSKRRRFRSVDLAWCLRKRESPSSEGRSLDIFKLFYQRQPCYKVGVL
jgi:hypothetical protein